MVVKTDFVTRGFNFNNLPGRLFQADEMINLLKLSGINSCPKEQITKVIDKIGVYLANNGSNFYNFYNIYLAHENKGIWAVTSTNLEKFSNFISKVFVDTVEFSSSTYARHHMLKVILI